MYEAFLTRMENQGKTHGQIRKTQSDDIMNQTWWDDIQSRVVYLYDYFHDNEPTTNYDRHPEEDPLKIPVDAKFIITQYETLSKDQVEYHLMFRPGQEDPTDYYEEKYHMTWSARFPVGLYVDVPDDDGVFNRWLIVAEQHGNQFIKYSILPCNYFFHWVYKNKLYDMCAVARLRNSYNSGEWTDNITTVVQNQSQVWFPQNSITSNLFYNQRFIIDSRTFDRDTKYESYLAWHTAKVENIFPPGIVKLTLAQDKFDPNKDRFDPTTDYMYADYSAYLSENSHDDDDNTYSKIVFNGRPELRVAGTGMTFTLKFFDKSENEITKIATSSSASDYWSFEIVDKDGTAIATQPAFDSIVTKVNNDVFKIKVTINDINLLGKRFILRGHDIDGTCTSDAILNITSL